MMADAYSTGLARPQTLSPAQIIGDARRAAALALTVYDALDAASEVLRRLAEMMRVEEFVCTLLEAGEAEHIDAVLAHLDVAAGAWRGPADQADHMIEGVAAAHTRAVLARAACVEAGTA
jgi:hypothetical protein